MQNFDVARDPRGAIYVANLAGVLTYDGAWWRLIPVGAPRNAFSVASDAGGRVAVGGVDEIGYLAPDPHGALRYVSLLGLLPAGERHLGQVERTLPTAGGFVFLTSRELLLWDGARIAQVATFPGERPLAVAFRVDDAVYLWTRQGIVRLAGRRLVPVRGGEAFAGRRVDEILPAEGGLLVSVRGEGLFLLRDGAVVPFAPEASRWAREKRVFSGCRLPDGRWALGSVLGGLLLLRPDGEVDQVIDSSVGLPDDFVGGMIVDPDGALWVSLNSGLARIEVASPLSIVDRRLGLQGVVYQVARHRGALWVATASGLYTNEPLAGNGRGASAESAPAAGHLRLHAVPGFPPAAWSLLSQGDDLLVGTAFGVYVLHDGSFHLVPGTEERTAYVLAPARAEPGSVWAGMSNGLVTLRRQGGAWRAAAVAGVADEVRTIVEGERGVVWCGTHLGGVLGIEPAAPGSGGLGSPVRRVPESGDVNLFRIAGRIVGVTEDRVRRLDEARGRWVDDPAYRVFAGHGDFSELAEDAEGNLWRNSRPPSVLVRGTGSGAPQLRSLIEVPAHGVEVIFAEPDGVVWLATEMGLLRYAGSIRGVTPPLPAPILARVTTEGGRLLRAGGAVHPFDVAPGVHRLRLEFAPLSYRAGLRYQTRLVPLEAGWNAPVAEPFVELGRLSPGAYALQVRSAGPSGEAGPAAAWPFVVRPAWYRTAWALALGLAALALAVAGYVRLRHRALRQRAARLEARVAEQTIELRQTVDELRRAQEELEAANARLEELSLQDELTGIANRRRLQQVLEAEWSRARRHGRSIAFCLLDLDHFKLLNDTRGHLEGDLCLRAVAAYLAQTVRRAEDLVARFGGEEFAVLLSNTDEAGALRLAEQLRQGIEELAIAHEASPLGHVTASFGVAALVPRAGQPLEVLLEAADLALYRAKTAGRNRAFASAVPDEGAGLEAGVN